MKKSTAYTILTASLVGFGSYLFNRINPDFDFEEYLNGRDFGAESYSGEERVWDMDKSELEAILRQDKTRKVQSKYEEFEEE